MNRNGLRSPWQFRLVYQDGKKINCKYAVLFYHQTGEPDVRPSFGFVASKRVGNAVCRNRAKRLLREVIRDTEKRIIKQDLWIVVVAKKKILECTLEQLSSDLIEAMTGEGLMRTDDSM